MSPIHPATKAPPPPPARVRAWMAGWLMRLSVLALGSMAPMILGMAPTANAHPESFAEIVQSSTPAVVHVRLAGNGEPAQPGRTQPGETSGSGFLISADGYLVTNHHLAVRGNRFDITFLDGQRFIASVVGLDAQTDLALLKVKATGLPFLRFGDSDALRVGDWVLAIGNPLGLNHSASAGIISAKGRNLYDDENVAFGEFLQTDAAINPGSSGGPLLNMQGRVIGVTTAISREGQGIGFALPANLVAQTVAQLKAHGKVRRGWLGLVIRPVRAETEPDLGLPARAVGLLVAEVKPDSPAMRADIRKGDVLTHYGTEPVTEVARLQGLVSATAMGASLGIRLLRRQGGIWQAQRVSLIMSALPD